MPSRRPKNPKLDDRSPYNTQTPQRPKPPTHPNLPEDVADILSGATVGSRTGVKAGLLALESLQA